MEYGDNISRQAAIDALNKLSESTYEVDYGAVDCDDAINAIAALPPVTPKQSLDIDKVSKEVLNAISKWLNSQDDKRDVLNVIKDVLSPTRGRSERCQNLKRLKSVNR